MNSRWRGGQKVLQTVRKLDPLTLKPITFFFRGPAWNGWENGLQVSVRTAGNASQCLWASPQWSPQLSQDARLGGSVFSARRNQGGLVRSEPSHLGQGHGALWEGLALLKNGHSRPLQKIYPSGTSLIVPWLRLHAPNHGDQVRS